MSSTVEEVKKEKLSEMIQFPMMCIPTGFPTRELWMIASKPNESGICLIVTIDQRRKMPVSAQKIRFVDSYLSGRSGEFFDKVDELVVVHDMSVESAVLDAIAVLNDSRDNDQAEVYTSYASKFVKWYEYINQLVADVEENKTADTKQEN